MAGTGNIKVFEPLADVPDKFNFMPLSASEVKNEFLPLLWRDPIQDSINEVQVNGQKIGSEISENPEPDTHGHSVIHTPTLQEMNELVVSLREELSRVHVLQDERVAAIETAYGKEFADKIVKALQSAEIRIRDEISAAVGTILRPFITERMEQKIVSAFADELSRCICESELTHLSIQGPDHLLEALKSIANGHFAEISYIVSDGLDLVASVNGKFLSTRIQYWNSLLHGEEA